MVDKGNVDRLIYCWQVHNQRWCEWRSNNHTNARKLGWNSFRLYQATMTVFHLVCEQSSREEYKAFQEFVSQVNR